MALGTIAGFGAARLAFMATLGLGRDEAYTLVISRKLALSYFDHPPLHQWLAHVAAAAFGETVLARLPFVLAFAVTGWLMFDLTRRLYGPRAGLAALIALNVTPFFFASAGTWIVPDGPLMLFLALAGRLMASIVLDASPSPWRLWLGLGVALGLAGLSKYTAALTGLGFVGFVLSGRAQRRWLAHPAPYVAAALALVLVAPVFVWNAGHDWVSFRFQGARGAPGSGAGALSVLLIALGQAGYLSPWIGFGLVAAAVQAIRTAAIGDLRARLLLCLALPPILIFTIAPGWSGDGLPHWTMPGWLFLYPAFGEWAARRGLARRAAVLAAAALAGLAIPIVAQARLGLVERLTGRSAPDPTLETLDWGPVRQAIGAPPAFVATTKWWEAGKLGVALGPKVPIFVFADDPRGVAFLDDSADFLGQDGVIVTEKRRLPYIETQLRPYFRSLDAPEPIPLSRGGVVEQELVAVRAHGLTRAFPVPYRHGRE